MFKPEVDPVILADQDRYVAEQQQQGIEAEQAADTYQRELFALARLKSSSDISSMPWLPQTAEHWAQDLHDRIETRERQLITPNLTLEEYKAGTASYPDEIKTIEGHGDYLFTAEHATGPIRLNTNEIGFADKGTGGLAAVMAEDYGKALIMLGQQTSNAPLDPEHPIKPLIASYLPTAEGFLGVHGCNSRLFVNDDDRTEVQAFIGLGADPTEEMHDFASLVTRRAKEDLGLYVHISNDKDHRIQQADSVEPKVNDDGTVKFSRLAALRDTSTPNFTRGELAKLGRAVSVMQLEMADFLLIKPYDKDPRDKVTRVIGVAMGYKLLELIVQLSKTDGPSTV